MNSPGINMFAEGGVSPTVSNEVLATGVTAARGRSTRAVVDLAAGTAHRFLDDHLQALQAYHGGGGGGWRRQGSGLGGDGRLIGQVGLLGQGGIPDHPLVLEPHGHASHDDQHHDHDDQGEPEGWLLDYRALVRGLDRIGRRGLAHPQGRGVAVVQLVGLLHGVVGIHLNGEIVITGGVGDPHQGVDVLPVVLGHRSHILDGQQVVVQ